MAASLGKEAQGGLEPLLGMQGADGEGERGGAALTFALDMPELRAGDSRRLSTPFLRPFLCTTALATGKVCSFCLII